LLVSFLLSTNSSAVIVAHNHPGGRSEFSLEDISLTKRLTEILQPLDIRLLDHVLYVPGEVDAPGKWMSMTKEGVI
jgi:DNA repair protein RadC